MKNITPKIKRMLPILFMVGMALTLLPAMTLAAPGDYNTGDVAVINYIITNNNLSSWTNANPDGSAIPGDWAGVIWSTALTDKRIVELDINSSNLEGALDVSDLTALETLYCYSNNLTSLDVSGLTALKELNCGNNINLASLDVSGCTALEDLRCVNNNLASLDVSGLTALVELACHNNNLASLDVSGLTTLEQLCCDFNNLASLDVSGLTALEILTCSNNNLASLDVSGLANIIYLDVRYNLMASESAVIGVTDATAFAAWETGFFYFSPQKSKTSGGGSSTGTAKIISGSTPTPPLSQEDTLPVNTIVSVSNVTLDKTNETLKAGEILQLIAAITPNNATNKGLNWSSSDPSVATVDANGRVTGLKDGTATITVTTSDGSFVASCVVTISGSVADTKTSIPGFAILTAMMGLLCAAVLFKWQQNQKKK